MMSGERGVWRARSRSLCTLFLTGSGKVACTISSSLIICTTMPFCSFSFVGSGGGAAGRGGTPAHLLFKPPGGARMSRRSPSFGFAMPSGALPHASFFFSPGSSPPGALRTFFSSSFVAASGLHSFVTTSGSFVGTFGVRVVYSYDGWRSGRCVDPAGA